jgi:hypothetical protein
MPLTIGRTKDGHPAIKIAHLTYALLPGRNSPLAIFYRWPARNPDECVASDFTSFDRQVDTEAEFVAHMEEIAEHYDEISRLGRTELNGSIPSYWGPTQTRTEYFPGIESVSTAGHGGFMVSPELNELVDPEWRNDACSYEEDSCWAIVAFTFPHLFTKREMKFANTELVHSYPDAWERLTGKTILPGQSRTRDERAFLAENADKLIVGSAVYSKKYDGYVECYAQKGGDRTLDPQKFLVPSAEYKTRKFGFVIDETRHVRFGPNTLPHAIDMLTENLSAQRIEIERLTEASLQAGDQTIAEALAEQLVDIDEVLPRLVNLIAMPGTTDPLLPDSKSPGRAERGMRIVYLETVKMLDGAKHDLANSRSKSPAMAQQVAVLETLLTKVRSLFHCAFEDAPALA